jgi:hypothetical protein
MEGAELYGQVPRAVYVARIIRQEGPVRCLGSLLDCLVERGGFEPRNPSCMRPRRCGGFARYSAFKSPTNRRENIRLHLGFGSSDLCKVLTGVVQSSEAMHAMVRRYCRPR